MSNYNQLPPQAYTRDVLAQAYAWLHEQPGSIQELATNADSLVALFMQSRRRVGHPENGNYVGPASTEAFKNDLKSLAEGLKQFDDAKTPMTVDRNMSAGLRPNRFVPPPAVLQMQVPVQAPMAMPPQAIPQVPQFVAPQPQFAMQNTMSQGAQMPTMPADSALMVSLDNKSAELVRRVQKCLNLSSESEAVRMLMTLGYEQIKAILPKGS